MHMDKDFGRFKELYDMSEDSIDLSATVEVSPGTNDTFVVSIDHKMCSPWNGGEECCDKELKAHCFCPCNILAIGVPAWQGLPRKESRASSFDKQSNSNA